MIRRTAFLPASCLPFLLPPPFYECACRELASQKRHGVQAPAALSTLFLDAQVFGTRIHFSSHEPDAITRWADNFSLKLAGGINNLRLQCSSPSTSALPKGRQPSLAAAFRLSDRCGRQSGAAAPRLTATTTSAAVATKRKRLSPLPQSRNFRRAAGRRRGGKAVRKFNPQSQPRCRSDSILCHRLILPMVARSLAHLPTDAQRRLSPLHSCSSPPTHPGENGERRKPLRVMGMLRGGIPCSTRAFFKRYLAFRRQRTSRGLLPVKSSSRVNKQDKSSIMNQMM